MNSILEMLKKPLVASVMAALLGILVGLGWGWGIQPVQWKDVAPDRLGITYQEDYLRMTIDSYAVSPNPELALNRWQALGPDAPLILATIVSNPGSHNSGNIVNFSQLVGPSSAAQAQNPAATPASTTSTPGSGIGGGSPLLSIAVIVLALLVVGAVIYFLFRFLRPMIRRTSGDGTPAQQAQQFSRQAGVTDYVSRGEEPPLAQFVTTYIAGDDLYDDLFSIDSPAGEFMGECGIGISETIGVGDPKKVSAFEVWIFDKNDIQTVTKVLMSAHAFNDVATYQRLEAKGEPVMAERGKQIVLDTAALQMIATITDMEYGQGALPDQSYFKRIILDLAVWPKITSPQ